MQGTLHKPEIPRKIGTNVLQEDADLQDRKGEFLNSEVFWTGEVLHSDKVQIVTKKCTEYGMTMMALAWVHF